MPTLSSKRRWSKSRIERPRSRFIERSHIAQRDVNCSQREDPLLIFEMRPPRELRCRSSNLCVIAIHHRQDTRKASSLLPSSSVLTCSFALPVSLVEKSFITQLRSPLPLSLTPHIALDTPPQLLHHLPIFPPLRHSRIRINIHPMPPLIPPLHRECPNTTPPAFHITRHRLSLLAHKDTQNMPKQFLRR